MKRVILLTSTVKPFIISKWYNATCEQRKKEYITAILFYLKKFHYPVVIVDNSNYDFNQDIANNSKFEALHYIASDHATLGKGYGECEILKYAVNNSRFLKDADQIIKITGRLVIQNLQNLLSHANNMSSVYCDSDIHFSFPRSYLFFCPPKFLIDEIFPRHNMMNDSEGVYFERVLGMAIKEWRTKKGGFHQFVYPICIEGHPGETIVPYKLPGITRYLIIMLKYIITEIIGLRYKVICIS